MSRRRAFDPVTALLLLAAVLVFVFIYLPLLVVIVYSFNPDSVNSFPMRGVSLRWYRAMIEDESLMKSLQVSVAIALGGTVIGVLLGVPGAIAIARYEFWGKK